MITSKGKYVKKLKKNYYKEINITAIQESQLTKVTPY